LNYNKKYDTSYSVAGFPDILILTSSEWYSGTCGISVGGLIVISSGRTYGNGIFLQFVLSCLSLSARSKISMGSEIQG